MIENITGLIGNFIDKLMSFDTDASVRNFHDSMILLIILGRLNSRPAPIHLTEPNSPQRTIFRKMRQTQSVAKELSGASTRTQYSLSII